MNKSTKSKNMKTQMQTIREKLSGHFDTIGKKKTGEFIARKEFYYRHGQDADKAADKLKKLMPEARITGSGEVFKAFRGGASTAQSSHWWVTFRL